MGLRRHYCLMHGHVSALIRCLQPAPEISEIQTELPEVARADRGGNRGEKRRQSCTVTDVEIDVEIVGSRPLPLQLWRHRQKHVQASGMFQEGRSADSDLQQRP